MGVLFCVRGAFSCPRCFPFALSPVGPAGAVPFTLSPWGRPSGLARLPVECAGPPLPSQRCYDGLVAAEHIEGHPTTLFHYEGDRAVCDVCPRACALRPGQRGLCFVRAAASDGSGVVLTTYGRSSGFCVDPIEKKPLNHFLPGSPVLSFGTAGCNLACKFCQNWDMSKSRRDGYARRQGDAGSESRRASRSIPVVAASHSPTTTQRSYSWSTPSMSRRPAAPSVSRPWR